MLGSKSVSFVCFFYTHCIKGYWNILIFVLFSAAYWAVDLQFRNWVFKEIIERFEIIPRESALSCMLPWIYMYFLSLVIRFFILRFSSYIRLYYTPLMKTNLMRFLIREVLMKSNVLMKKDLDVLSNQIQEVLKNCQFIIEKVFIDFIAHFVLLISPFYMFYGQSFLLYGMFALYFSFFLTSYIGYLKGVRLNANIISFEMILFSRFNDIFSNLFNVKLFKNYDYEEEKLNPFYDKFQQVSIERDFWYLIINGCLSIIFIFYHCFCMLFLIWQYQVGVISKAYFPYVITNNKDITEALWYVIDDCIAFSEAVGKTVESLDRIFSHTYALEAKARDFSFSSYDISFDHVSFSYPNSKDLLFNDLSFHIKEGDKVGIVGYSGSGKSSLASLLLNLISIQDGEIKIGGCDISLLSHDYLHSSITYMNQDLSLFNRTIRENIAYSCLSATEEAIIYAARMANIHDFIQELPNGYDTILEFRGNELSYGQKQRILIARAFLRNTPILILDEVTSSLDAKSESIVMKSLYELMKGKTVIVIAHKIKTLLNMDYIVVMSKGRIVEIGTQAELLQKKSLYYELATA